ncbi:methylenetetrahydrofolate reductase [Haloechinothrix salitolerans]|uniref:Methylenetetrahydrofolate reductase n=1 Tax=Haloechinothrix salitolerans TaxID=926830 RepID=A0ABW2BSL0_9PSEU
MPRALEATEQLPAGSVVTVTASPHKGLHATIDLVEDVAAQGMRAVPHLAARQFRDSAELAGVLDRLDAAGIDEVFVVGGDNHDPAGDFADGLALLRGMADLGRLPTDVGVPSYPEGHHTIDDATLWTSLRAKQEYATYTVTQLCFDADAICRFAAEARRRGITLPVVVGAPGVVDVTKLLRVGLKIGVGDSLRFARGNASVTGKLLRPGGYRPDGLVRKLASRVAYGDCTLAGLHFYTFNHVAATARWVRNTHRRAA